MSIAIIWAAYKLKFMYRGSWFSCKHYCIICIIILLLGSRLKIVCVFCVFTHCLRVCFLPPRSLCGAGRLRRGKRHPLTIRIQQ